MADQTAAVQDRRIDVDAQRLDVSSVKFYDARVK